MRLYTVTLLFLTSIAAQARVRTGLELLATQDFAPLTGKRIGVVANQNAVIPDGKNILALIAASKNVKLGAIFSPEHGFQGTAEAGVLISSSKDAKTGAPIYSLHGGPDSLRPKPEMMKGIDVLLFDLPEVGGRFWTYTTTMIYVMEAAAKSKIPFYVLDRPNPINGEAVEGPLLDDSLSSFIGYGRRPVRHGMTMGELAQMFNAERKIGAELHVVAMEGWSRKMWLDETGLDWITPSPNIRNLTAAALFPATCLVETSMVSVGRGTDTPFVVIGAPWFKAQEVSEYLNGQKIPGVRFVSRHFTPTEPPYKGEAVYGLDIQLVDRAVYDSWKLGLALLAATLKFHPQQFHLDRKAMLLLGNAQVGEMLRQQKPLQEIESVVAKQVASFRAERQKYLLYK